MSTVHRLLSTESVRLPLWLPVCVGVGIALYFAQSAPLALGWFIASTALLLVILRFFHRIAWVKIIALALLAASLGAGASALRMKRVEAPVLSDTVYFKKNRGVVEDIQSRESKTKIFLAQLEVEGLPAEETPKRASISLKNLSIEINIGDRIEIPAMLFPPPAPAMPDAYDFGRMFYFDQLGAVGFSPRQPVVLEKLQAQNFSEKLTALRLSIAQHLQKNMGKEEGPVASAMMVGEQSRVSDEVAEAMRNSGIYHILSISGLHMTLACGTLFFVVRLLLAMVPSAALRWPIKKIAAVAGLFGGFGYLLLAGYPVPAIRSYVMVACVLVAVLCDRRGLSFYSLAWAAALILLFSPESLFTASFQLSFAATVGIVMLYERYGHVFFHAHASPIKRLWLYGLGLLLTSLAASAFTTPLAIYHFNRMAVWGVAANMLVVPLSSFIIMPAALLVFITMPFGFDAPFIWVLNEGIHIMVKSAYYVAALPYANIMFPSPSTTGLVCLVVGGLWFALWLSNIRWLGLVVVALGLSTIVLHQPYDLIINDEAKRVAYRTADDRWVFVRGEVDSFEAELWLRSQGKAEAIDRKQAAASVPELKCEKDICFIERAGKKIEVVLRKEGNEKLCKGEPDIVITDKILYERCSHVDYAIDADFVSQHGAVGVRFLKNSKIQLEKTQEKRGHWPWSLSSSKNLQ